MRIGGKGIIDQKCHLRFTFDGQPLLGHPGDTLASALLANDILLVGRSFKYHRPRGVMTAGSEEPNALVTMLRGGGVQEPNTRATMQPLYDHLVARSQNCWPGRHFDVMQINDLFAPFLGAGFYYKTFMWPKAFWEKLYEPVIRRAAGMGALADTYDGDKYEKAFAHCDLLIIGAGPAGLMAALAAGRAGVDVILADEDERMGGQVLSETHDIDGKPGHLWVDDVLAELRSLKSVRLMPRTSVTGAYDGGEFGALTRNGHHLDHLPDGMPLETFWRISASRAILCAGALERPIAFPANDRPGIMTASAVRTYLNRYGAVAGRKMAVFGNNDSAHRTALDLRDAGIEVTALIDTREGVDVPGADFPVYAGAEVAGTRGHLGLRKIKIRQGDKTTWVAADGLGVSGGWNPSVHLTCHMNARPVWNDDLAAFLPPERAVPGLTVAGSAAGHMSTAACLASGRDAGLAMVKALGKRAKAVELPKAEDVAYAITPHWEVRGKGRAWLDFQNDVTSKDVRQAAAENYTSVEHMKRYTTQGMATDQGKNSNVAALAVLADATGRSIPQTGTTTFRPPYTPVALAALGAGAQGKGFAPERRTTSHTISADMGAPFIEAGLWYRPSFFPQEGETHWRQSCDREVGMVRTAVGVCDVSTLGKIDIQGPDAAEFLNFVYTNRFDTLKVGRVRYGIMLREDGHVMDDGTTARLGDQHYLMTTTTAAAGQVMAHLDFVRQGLRPDWKVAISSVTEHWAQFAVAGPNAAAVLADVLDDFDPDAFPFMGCGDVAIGGIHARLFRISFSGEAAYEVAVPARYGQSLYQVLLDAAGRHGGGAYGMEALNVLRIEKGFLTHAELHGRTTAFDLGLQGMLSPTKQDFIGKAAAARPGLMNKDRAQLVGLKPAGAVKQILPGAHLFDLGADAVRQNDLGYITSACYSPTFGTSLALGFLNGGRTRMGNVVLAVDHLRGLKVQLEVCDPVFFDKDGGRMRG
ncbi:MAG: sarcosine oxidase subunit alpha family protein [Planktomarina sp.]